MIDQIIREAEENLRKQGFVIFLVDPNRRDAAKADKEFWYQVSRTLRAACERVRQDILDETSKNTFNYLLPKEKEQIRQETIEECLKITKQYRHHSDEIHCTCLEALCESLTKLNHTKNA